MMLAIGFVIWLLPPCGRASPGFSSNFLSLRVEGSASDEYLSTENYGVGQKNAITLDVSLQGMSGTITSADKEVDIGVDTLELFGGLSVPKWFVLEPPKEFTLRSISVVEPVRCAGTPVTDGGRNYSFYKAGKRYVLQLPELSQLKCGDLKVHVVTRNPGDLLYPYDSRWKAYLASKEVILSDFNDSAKPWKHSLIAKGYWEGVFPLKSKVCGLLSGEWTLNSSVLCPLGGAVTTNETELLATLIRDYSFSAGMNVSAVVVTCPGPAVKVSMAPLDQGTKSASASEALSRIMLSYDPPEWSGATQLKEVGKPVWSCKQLSDKVMMSDNQSIFFWFVGAVTYVYFLVALAGGCFFGFFHSGKTDLVAGLRSYFAILISLFSLIPAVIGACYGVAILALCILLIGLCERIVNLIPMAEDDPRILCNYLVELVFIAPLRTGMHLLRFLYDFIIVRAAMLFLLPFGLPDIPWFTDLCWHDFFSTLPDWCFIRWWPFSWMTHVFTYVAYCLSSAFGFVRSLGFHIGMFVAPCRETVLLSSTPFVYMAVFVLYFFTTQDVLLRLVPATVTAQQKRNIHRTYAPIIVACFYSPILAFIQFIANALADMLVIGLPPSWVNLSAAGTMLPDDFCSHPVKIPVVITARLSWLISVVAFVLMSYLILTGRVYQNTEIKPRSAKHDEKTEDDSLDDGVAGNKPESMFSNHSEERQAHADAYNYKLISFDEEWSLIHGCPILGRRCVSSDSDEDREESLWAWIMKSKVASKLTSLDYLLRDIGKLVQAPSAGIHTHIFLLIQITLGLWIEKRAESSDVDPAEEGLLELEDVSSTMIDSVKIYNLEVRKDWCMTQIYAYLHRSTWAPDSRDFARRSLAAMESHADETILHITTRQLSTMLACTYILTFCAKTLEYMNQVPLWDYSHSLKIHEQFSGFCIDGFWVMLPLWLSSAGRLVCLFIMTWSPYCDATFENLQTVFAVVSILCAFAGYYGVVSNWGKHYLFEPEFQQWMDFVKDDEQHDEEEESNVRSRSTTGSEQIGGSITSSSSGLESEYMG